MKLSIVYLGLAACGGGNPMVPDAPPEPVDITIKAANTALVAAQDGDGAWQALTGTDGVYHLSVHDAHYAVAVACAPNAAAFVTASVFVYARGVGDDNVVDAGACFRQEPARVNVTITVPNLAADERAEVWGADTFDEATAGTPAVLQVLPGHIDMLIRKRTQGSTLTSLVYRTALDATADKALTVDLAAVGKPPDHLPLSVTNVDASETARVSTSFAPGVAFAGIQMPLESEALAGRYALIPTALRQPTDISNVTVTATRQTGNRIDDRFVRLAMNPPIQPTLTLPPAVAFTAPTLDATPLRRATIKFPLTPATLGHLEYEAFFSTTDAQGLPNGSWSLYATPGWSTDLSTLTFVMPDLSALPGWTAALALQPGPVSWTLQRYEGNMPIDTPPVDGRKFVINDASDTLN